MQSTVLDAITEAIRSQTGDSTFKAQFGARGYGGGGGASVGTITDASNSGSKYFCKSGHSSDAAMLKAEYLGIKEMHETQTVRVPRPIAFGQAAGQSFAVFEYLDLGRSGGESAAKEFGRNLARMHQHTSPNGKFGFHCDNTCGATPQPNAWTDSWTEFWDQHRLGHMLRLCERDGAVFGQERELRAKVKELLSRVEVKPALVHGDLWTGNAAYTKDGQGCIFDPATYYGHSEVDIAMTELFGSFAPGFYAGYNEVLPPQPGHEQRKVIYNMYHMLNHYVLFGGGYWQSAMGYATKILRMS